MSERENDEVGCAAAVPRKAKRKGKRNTTGNATHMWSVGVWRPRQTAGAVRLRHERIMRDIAHVATTHGIPSNHNDALDRLKDAIARARSESSEGACAAGDPIDDEPDQES